MREIAIQTESTPVPQVETNERAHRSLSGKIYDYYRMLVDDKDYRRGFLSMMMNQCGDGMVTGGVLYLLSRLAVLDPGLSAVGIAVFTLVEIAIASISYLLASHSRDNTEQAKRDGEDGDSSQVKHGRRLCLSGLIDGVSSLLLLGGVAAVGLGFFGAPAIFLAVVAVKAVQAYNKNFESGAWHCLKYNLGSPETQQKQLSMRSTIGALELSTGGMAYGLVSLGTLLLVSALAVSAPTIVPFVSIGAAVVGGLMTCLPKISFGLYAVKQKIKSTSNR